jgi:hypothetical protein
VWYGKKKLSKFVVLVVGGVTGMSRFICLGGSMSLKWPVITHG